MALICNLIVVSGGVFHHVRAGNLKTGLILPFALTSVPMALVGGSLAVSEQVFRLVLGTALVLGGLMMLKPVAGDRDRGRQPDNRVDWRIATPIGAVLGLLAGVTGIGGGIYLGPIMHLAGWAESRVVAATTSAFILVNSLAALAGHLGKWPETTPGWADRLSLAAPGGVPGRAGRQHPRGGPLWRQAGAGDHHGAGVLCRDPAVAGGQLTAPVRQGPVMRAGWGMLIPPGCPGRAVFP